MQEKTIKNVKLRGAHLATMDMMRIRKEMLVDDTTREILERPFNLDNEDVRWDIYYHYFPRHCVQQFCWLADQCAEELTENTSFDQYSFFVNNVGFLWECFYVLPNEFKEAFKEYGDAICKTAKEVEQLFTQ